MLAVQAHLPSFIYTVHIVYLYYSKAPSLRIQALTGDRALLFDILLASFTFYALNSL